MKDSTRHLSSLTHQAGDSSFSTGTVRISRIQRRWPGLMLVLALLSWVQLAIAAGPLDEQLVKAAERDDVATVKILLERGVDVDARNELGVTALMSAAIEGHLELLNLLLEKGANVNASSRTGMTPLIATAGGKRMRVRSNHLRIVELLVQSGADVNARDNGGATALHCAAWVQDGTDVVRCLLDHGADVNAKDEHGLTPLLQAVSGYNHWDESLELIELLLDRGADVNAKALNGKTALLEASAGDHQIDVRKWYQVAWDRLKFQLWGKEWGPLYPPGARSPQAVELLLNRGADVKATDRRGWTALDRAQNRGAAEIVKVLRAHGAKE